MKKTITLCLFLIAFSAIAQSYQPTPANVSARQQFQNDKFGMFIHWGLSSMLSHGEWVMNDRKIRADYYEQLAPAFYPSKFNAAQWVSTAKAAGMQYVVFITRHHDGFSNWDTKQSNFKITNTPFKRDVLKELAAECKKQNMKLGLYYSLLDWNRSDYPYETGRTGKHSGRTKKSDYNSYFNFMKNQLTELLTNYGEVMCIWFDGHWDQTNVEGSKDMSSRLNWRYEELYKHIHSIQPKCLIGNNHHLSPIAGEDFQMFERDLPGQNHSGLSFQEVSNHLPLETCETINGSWGYNITDTSYKSVKQLIHYLVNAACLNTNFLLNVGPKPTGQIQQQFKDTLAQIGNWLHVNGNSIYGTRGSIIEAQPWGNITGKGKKLYVHILNPNKAGNNILIPIKNAKAKEAWLFGVKKQIGFLNNPNGIELIANNNSFDPIDTIIEVTVE